MAQLQEFPRAFLEEDFTAGDITAVIPAIEELESRTIANTAELERWCLDWSELESILDEEGSRRYVDQSRRTDDPESKARFLQWVEEFEPVLKKSFFRLRLKLAESPYAAELDPKRFGTFLRSVRNSVEIFRDENVPLETEDTKLESRYDEIIGAMTVSFQGEERTLPQMSRYLQDGDRTLRENAFRAIWKRILVDADELESIFDRQVALRQEMAENAGFDDYRALRFRQLERFDYSVAECMEFHDAIASEVVPLVRERAEKRRAKLGVETLRPWDTAVDLHGRLPLRPFEDDRELMAGCREIFERVDPILGERFEVLMERDLLDLESRKGKAPGGFQCTFQECRLPFIFMNAAGLQSDVQTLLHEGGHAFHTLESRSLPLCANRNAPIEFAEVASMSMELLAHPHYEVFYDDPADARRARIEHLDHVISILPWTATIDVFQHWIYTNPRASHDERTSAWLEILDRFSGGLDWSGLEEVRRRRWLRQPHLFSVPFYYIEYGIAQLGALQVWRNYRNDPNRAVEAYRRGLSLGNTRPLPELFEAAGIRFAFSAENVGELVGMARKELERLESEDSQ